LINIGDSNSKLIRFDFMLFLSLKTSMIVKKNNMKNIGIKRFQLYIPSINLLHSKLISLGNVYSILLIDMYMRKISKQVEDILLYIKFN